MYSTIELAECPRCGSPHKEPLGADRYRCANCGLHYHLDWVGASVQVRQPAAARPSPTIHQDWLTLRVLLLVGLAMLALVGLSFWAAPGK